MERTFWTNTSVLALAGTGNPLAILTERIRTLICEAADCGWSGPPFDPFALAGILGIPVEPREDIDDARTVPLARNRLKIEYNPTKPRRRIRYSLAHEIAHTVFPDCSDRVRNRTSRSATQGDEWQLEMLCNLGAAELLMPAANLSEVSGGAAPSIDRVLTLAKEFEVSVEAVLLRVVSLLDVPCYVFASSTFDDQGYILNYVNSSGQGYLPLLAGKRLHRGAAVAQCSAVGHTVVAHERWMSPIGEVRVECVGLPPYPGQIYPRIAGILIPEDSSQPRLNYLRQLKGDALNPIGDEPKIIAHVVNDRARSWGAGFGRAVQTQYPQVKAAFQGWIASAPSEQSLGSIFVTKHSDGLAIAQMIAQKGYGDSPQNRLRYGALRECLAKLAEVALARGMSVHMPRIGTGYGGGEWSLIRELVQAELVDRGIPVTIYQLPDEVSPRDRMLSLFD